MELTSLTCRYKKAVGYRVMDPNQYVFGLLDPDPKFFTDPDLT